MAKFNFIVSPSGEKENKDKSPSYATQLSDVILKRNILWFIELRIIVIGVLILFGFTSILFSNFLYKIGISSPVYWPFTIAFVLLLANLGFWLCVNFNLNRSGISPAINLWLQIIVDLIALTTVVHFFGSTNTPAAFLFVVHIALSCIFFNLSSSFIVTLAASLLYFICVFLEFSGILSEESIFIIPTQKLFHSWHKLLWAGSVISIFFIIWFIVSRLSYIIRIREKQLISIQEDLKRIQKTKDQYGIQMTHQLKAPLDAIRSTIMLITKGYYGEIEKDLLHVMKRIEIRAKGMGDLILDVLRLARLLDPKDNRESFENINLADLLKKLITTFKTSAEPRGITFKTEITKTLFSAVPEQLNILFSNLISNAVTYSYDKGIVTIKCHPDRNNAPVVVVSDNGIGIPEDKLPNIFNEYFKTKEAMKHNPASTGIGLSMVKRIAEFYTINITIESELGKGTSFTLKFPET